MPTMTDSNKLPEPQSAAAAQKQKQKPTLFNRQQQKQKLKPAAATAPTTKIYALICKTCQEEMSGPNLAKVKSAMLRHQLKKGHLLYKTEVRDAGQAGADKPAEAVTAPAAPAPAAEVPAAPPAASAEASAAPAAPAPAEATAPKGAPSA